MKDLHKSARQLWQQFADAGVNLDSIKFQTIAHVQDGKVIWQDLVNIAFNARLLEGDDESQKAQTPRKEN